MGDAPGHRYRRTQRAALHQEVVRPERTMQGKESTHSLPLSLYGDTGGLAATPGSWRMIAGRSQNLWKWESRNACVVGDDRVARGRDERLRGEWPVMDADVIIVGAGPTGLMLACELRLAGVRALVLERQPQIRDIPKAGGLSGQILELLRYRGELERFEAASTAPRPASAGSRGAGCTWTSPSSQIPRWRRCRSRNRDSSASSTSSPASSAPRSAAAGRWSG